jgi:opacity protein-like surface antigen
MAARRTRLATAALVVFVFAPGAFAQAPAAPPRNARFHLHALGSFPLAAKDFSEERPFREFAEDGRILADYAAGSGPGFEGGLQFDFSRRFGVQVALALQARNDSAAWSAELPHPLYLNHDRKVAGDLGGLRHTENAGHLDLVLLVPGDRFAGSLFAGPSVVSAKAELIRAVEYNHTYPYDTVTVTGTPTGQFSDNAYGFNAGAAVSWKVARRVALRAQGRYTVAKIKLLPAEGHTLELDAGGLALGLGASVGF